MSRSNWILQIRESGVWGAASTIIRPNSSFIAPIVSTQTRRQSANGDNIFFTPSTKYLKEGITWVWYSDTGSLKTQIEGYITSQNDLKITDDLSNIIYGRFTSITPTRIAGQESEEWDIEAVFTVMPNIA
jgi:hypothetical protein